MTVLPAGETVRFVVVDEHGQRSCSWSLKTDRNNDHVYLWERATAQEFKISLHNTRTADPTTASKPWRLAMDAKRAGSEERVVIWQGDVPAPAGRLLIGPQVLSCRRYLRPDQRPLNAGTIVIPLRAGIDAVRFKVVLADTEAQITGGSWSAVGIVSRANGSVAAVIVESVEVTEDAYDGIEYVLSSARAGITDPPLGARIIGVFGKDDLGLPIHIDLPLDRPLDSDGSAQGLVDF